MDTTDPKPKNRGESKKKPETKPKKQKKQKKPEPKEKQEEPEAADSSDFVEASDEEETLRKIKQSDREANLQRKREKQEEKLKKFVDIEFEKIWTAINCTPV